MAKQSNTVYGLDKGALVEILNIAGAALLMSQQVMNSFANQAGRLTVLILVVVVAALATLSAWRALPSRVSPILGPDGVGIKSDRVKFGWIRRIAAPLVLSSAIVLLAFDAYSSYSAPAIDVRNVEKVGLSSVARVDDKEVPFAYIIDQNSESPSTVVTGAFVVKCDIVKDPSHSWVSLDHIEVIVERWNDVPKYQVFPQALPHFVSLYVVEIDKPARSKPQSFRAQFLFENEQDGGEISKWVPLRIDDDKLRTLFVRVIAKTPGLYTFKIVAHVLSENSERQYTLWPSESVIFDRPEVFDED